MGWSNANEGDVEQSVGKETSDTNADGSGAEPTVGQEANGTAENADGSNAEEPASAALEGELLDAEDPANPGTQVPGAMPGAIRRPMTDGERVASMLLAMSTRMISGKSRSAAGTAENAAARKPAQGGNPAGGSHGISMPKIGLPSLQEYMENRRIRQVRAAAQDMQRMDRLQQQLNSTNDPDEQKEIAKRMHKIGRGLVKNLDSGMDHNGLALAQKGGMTESQILQTLHGVDAWRTNFDAEKIRKLAGDDDWMERLKKTIERITAAVQNFFQRIGVKDASGQKQSSGPTP